MCTDQAPAGRPRIDPQVLHDFDPGVVFDLEPVDWVTVTTLMDNVTDIFMPDQGPARRPPAEPGFPPQQAWLGGRWAPDPLVLDDQALVVDVAGKGLVVITGCGHAGIVNICRYARRLARERPLYAVIGGFHLNGPVFEPLIPAVLDDLAALSPSVIVPAHCTGWRAQHAIAARFGEAFVPDTVGTRFTL